MRPKYNFQHFRHDGIKDELCFWLIILLKKNSSQVEKK